MKNLIKIAGLSLVSAQQEFLKEVSDSFSEITNKFGNLERVLKDDLEGFEKEVMLKSNNHFYFDYD